jgi:hypothetical protein
MIYHELLFESDDFPSQTVKLPKGRFETCCYLVVGSGLEMNISLHDGEQVGATS